MKKDTTWKILSEALNAMGKGERPEPERIIDILLDNRGIKTKQEREKFLHPILTAVTPKNVGIDSEELAKALKRLRTAQEKKEQVIVFGDYDVDGITGTAILWETLYSADLNVSPYIPSRTDEGYGLSIKGIENVLIAFPQTKLIITVDNGIVANEAVDFANTKGIDVIITDHHTVGKKLPGAFAIVHTTKLCGAGVAWVTCSEFDKPNEDHLALVALATVADLVPLLDANRALLAYGLEILKKTKRVGIIALCEDAGIEQKNIDVYAIGHILSPRLNAMGRIASAMDSLRLLCTKDRLRAKALAEKLGLTNRERQLMTSSFSDHAILAALKEEGNVLFIADSTYDEGVIGLVAGKLVERYYRPSIVLSIGEKISKASARSITGFNIIAFIRSAEHLLINAGGHPMAAGFTVATENISILKEFIQKSSKDFDTELLKRILKIDCRLPLEFISQKLFDTLQTLQPFGMGNPEPVFVSDAIVETTRQIGKDKNHLSMLLKSVIPSVAEGSQSKNRDSSTSLRSAQNNKGTLQAIAFGMGELSGELPKGQKVEIAYTVSENVWKNTKSLQLKIKDIKVN